MKNIADVITRLAEELYREYHPVITPLRGKVLLFVLPREMRHGSIWLPDNNKDANKVTYEGIILKTWLPYVKTEVNWDACGLCATDRKKHDKLKHSFKPMVQKLVRESQFKPGDYVLFSHYAGQPVSKETDKYFRLVAEETSDAIGTGEIFAKIEYEKSDVISKIVDKLERYSGENWVEKCSGKDWVINLMNDFVIYPKESKILPIANPMK